MNYQKFVLLFENTAEESNRYFLPMNIVQFLKLLLEEQYNFYQPIKLFNKKLNPEQPSVSNNCQTVFIYFNENPWESENSIADAETTDQEESLTDSQEEKVIVTNQELLNLKMINERNGFVDLIEISKLTLPDVAEYFDRENISEEVVLTLFKNHRSKIVSVLGEDYTDNDIEDNIRTIINAIIENTTIEYLD